MKKLMYAVLVMGFLAAWAIGLYCWFGGGEAKKPTFPDLAWMKVGQKAAQADVARGVFKIRGMGPDYLNREFVSACEEKLGVHYIWDGQCGKSVELSSFLWGYDNVIWLALKKKYKQSVFDDLRREVEQSKQGK